MSASARPNRARTRTPDGAKSSVAAQRRPRGAALEADKRELRGRFDVHASRNSGWRSNWRENGVNPVAIDSTEYSGNEKSAGRPDGWERAMEVITGGRGASEKHANGHTARLRSWTARDHVLAETGVAFEAGCGGVGRRAVAAVRYRRRSTELRPIGNGPRRFPALEEVGGRHADTRDKHQGVGRKPSKPERCAWAKKDCLDEQGQRKEKRREILAGGKPACILRWTAPRNVTSTAIQLASARGLPYVDILTIHDLGLRLSRRLPEKLDAGLRAVSRKRAGGRSASARRVWAGSGMGTIQAIGLGCKPRDAKTTRPWGGRRMEGVQFDGSPDVAWNLEFLVRLPVVHAVDTVNNCGGRRVYAAVARSRGHRAR